MATFRFECNSKPTRNGKHTIFLCVTIAGKRKRTKTNIELDSPKQFNSKCRGDNWIRANVPESKKWNEELHDLLEEAKDKYSELAEEKVATSEKLVNELKSVEISSSFLQFAKDKTQDLLNAGRIGNFKKYNCFINKLEVFLKAQKKSDLLFCELTSELVSNFDNHLHKIRSERDSEKVLHANTIQKYLKVFRTLVNRAIEMGYIKHDENPFLFYKVTGVKTEKEKLTEEELSSLLALELEEGSLLWHSRNAFFFSFFCAGIRVGDLIQLRWNNITSDGRLFYSMGKNHKIRDLILVEQAKEILNHYSKLDKKANNYIFPLLDIKKPYAKAVTQAEKDTLPLELKKKLYNDVSAKSSLLNKYLRKLGEMAGIEKPLSMHISRHSFARLAKKEGTDNSILQNLLAHSSVAITEGYMGNFDTSTTDKALQKIFNKTIKEGTRTAQDKLIQKSAKENKREELLALLEGMGEEELSSLLASIRNPQPSL